MKAVSLPRATFFAQQLGWAGWTGLAALLVGLTGALLVAPQIDSGNAQAAARIDGLGQRIAALQDSNVARANRDPLAALMSALPPASAVPDFLAAIQRRADEGAVQIDRTEYRVQAVMGGAAQRYRLSFPAHVDYPHLRAWLEALLHDYPNLALDEIALRREVDGGEELEARIAVSFIVRSGK
jgi:hypothetical protein